MGEQKKPRVEMLLSCVSQNNADLARRENFQCDAVIINKADVDKLVTEEINGHQVRMYFTTDKGLAKSRNMAIRRSTADICMICDDDEIFYDGYVDRIIQAYEEHPDTDVIAFQIRNSSKKYSPREFEISFLGTLHISSWQISFRRRSIVNAHVGFNELFGAGAPFPTNGEEHLFLQDCLRAGLRIAYVPVEIGEMIDTGQSQWFTGRNRTYFVNRGIVTGYQLGKTLATAYAFYFAILKYSLYKEDCGFILALQSMLQGIHSSKIHRPKRNISFPEVY